MMENWGRLLLVVGAAFILLGLAFTMAGRLPLLGRLPGDIHLRRGQAEIYLPLATCLLLSLLATLILNLIWRLLHR